MQRQTDGQTGGTQHGDHRGGLHADAPQHRDEGERQHAVAHDRRQEICHSGVDAAQLHHAVQRIADHAGHDRTNDQDNDGGDDIHRVLDQLESRFFTNQSLAPLMPSTTFKSFIRVVLTQSLTGETRKNTLASAASRKPPPKGNQH